MREIEFKAKMVDGGVWVYGYYCELAGRKYIIPDYSQFRDIHDADLENSFTEIIPETVGQFTGLKDKNGVEIYEGSIFSNGSFVIWHGCAFVLQTKLGKFPLWKSNIDGLMVIGNIHDDPELLK